MQSGEGDFGKLAFLAKFQTMPIQTFKKSTIQSVFRNTGLILYNPEVVFQKVRALPRSTRTIILPPSDFTNKMTSVCTTTPNRPYEIKNQAHMLIKSMMRDQRLVHPKFQPYLDRFIRGSVTNSLQCFIAKRNLEITHREAIAQVACKKLIGRVAQKRRVITVRDVHTKVTKRVETEVEKARRALEQAEAAELKKENAGIATHKNYESSYIRNSRPT